MGYAALARLWLFESTKSRCARCSGGGGGWKRRNDPVGFYMGMGFLCVGWSGISLSLGGNMPVWMDWMGVWYAISTGKNKIGKRCLSNNLSVCLAVMFLYTSRSNNL